MRIPTPPRGRLRTLPPAQSPLGCCWGGGLRMLASIRTSLARMQSKRSNPQSCFALALPPHAFKASVRRCGCSPCPKGREALPLTLRLMLLGAAWCQRLPPLEGYLSLRAREGRTLQQGYGREGRCGRKLSSPPIGSEARG